VALQLTDLVVIQRGAALYKGTVADIIALAPGGSPSGAGNPVLTTVEVDLGAKSRRSGKFTISGLSGLTVGKPVLVRQAVGPYTGKGTRADEAEMDYVSCTAVVASASTITVYWQASGRVKGNRKFNYFIGA
jgi:hypothetical protein